MALNREFYPQTKDWITCGKERAGFHVPTLRGDTLGEAREPAAHLSLCPALFWLLIPVVDDFRGHFSIVARYTNNTLACTAMPDYVRHPFPYRPGQYRIEGRW